MAVQMTKSQLIEKIAANNELAKKDVKGVLETLATIGYKELKKTGVFLVPGFAKFVVIKKPATKARAGTNPFNGEPMMFKAKPGSKNRQSTPGQGSKRRGMNFKGPFWGLLRFRVVLCLDTRRGRTLNPYDGAQGRYSP